MFSPNILHFVSLYSSFCVPLKGEKLQNVLGHFQKDFEGGVSAENLGKLERVQPEFVFLKMRFQNLKY